VLALVGGAAFGYAMSRICGWLISLLKDSVTTEVTLTVALTYFTFVVSNEVLGISGVVATVTLATFVGSGSRTRVSPGSWEILHNVWQQLDFWATSFIFIISAMYIPRALNSFTLGDLVNVAVVFGAALASRAVVIGGMMPTFTAIGASKPLRKAYKIVLWWGGMRGAVTVALALATTATDGVPPAVRHLVASTAIGYVIASLVLNGLTLRPLMKFLALDKFNELDLVLRNRMVALARKRIRRELTEIAAAIGFDAEELSNTVVPADRIKLRVERNTVGLAFALDTWCHHELDTVLAFRERGLITRHHADMLRSHADRLLHGLRNGEVDGYREELEKLRRASMHLRISFWLHRHFGWTMALRTAVTSRMEYLVAELLLIRDLADQCELAATRLFGKDVTAQLKEILDGRTQTTESELKVIEQAYPKFAGAMHERYLTLVALGLVEAEYRRHLSEATISIDIFEDLDAERRAIAARFTKRPDLEPGLDVDSLTSGFPLIAELPELRSCLKPHLAFPGERIKLSHTKTGPCVHFIVFGQVDAQGDEKSFSLGPGDFLAQETFFPQCRRVTSAVSAGYVNMVEVDWPRLELLMESNAALKTELESQRTVNEHTIKSNRRKARRDSSRRGSSADRHQESA
jgi:CPA1 family monovalent cation:H+ antiporter